MILIISDKNDITIYKVIYYLRQLGIPYTLFNVGDYPLKLNHISKWIDSSYSLILETSEGQINSSDITAVWYRKPDLPKIPSNLNHYEKEYVYNETRESLHGIYNHLQHAFWMSPLQNIKFASNKPLQLSIAHSLGLKIPKTIITNNVDEAWDFYIYCKNNVIYKTLSTGVLTTRQGPWAQPKVHGEIYSTLLSGLQRSDFKKVETCPCLFQEYINKKFELRIILVKERVFAAEIHSQENDETKHDWRKNQSVDIPYKIHKLPQSIEKKCIELTKKLGLNYGAIDMIVSPENEYVFLEINPNGQFAWLEGKTELEISKSIAYTLADYDINKAK